MGSRPSAALTAYRCGLLGLIPFLGLVLGPAAFVMGFIVWRKDETRADERSYGQAVAAMILGLLILVTQWTGLLLMIRGLGLDS